VYTSDERFARVFGVFVQLVRARCQSRIDRRYVVDLLHRIAARDRRRLVFIRPVAVRDTFELTLIDGVFLEHVAEGALESLPESVLVFFRLGVTRAVFP